MSWHSLMNDYRLMTIDLEVAQLKGIMERLEIFQLDLWARQAVA